MQDVSRKQFLAGMVSDERIQYFHAGLMGREVNGGWTELFRG